ncbi:MAG: 5-formyltetrahydrofolate cyclo-ligase [Planctomycetota bacterium]
MEEKAVVHDDSKHFQEQKKLLREQAHERRNAQTDKDSLSELICNKLMAADEYISAKTILWYVDVRSEVRTRQHLGKALDDAKKIAVPYCVDGYLKLFHLADLDELSLGKYRILEPKTDLRSLPEKAVDPQDLDLVVVPGVGFDVRGARMGHGFGYYDKLLERVRPGIPLLALAFDCQIFPEIPVAPHDVFMTKVLTETTQYPKPSS